MATVMPLPLKPRAAERHAVRQLMNVELFTRNVPAGWPTPLLSDEAMEYWAQRYEFHGLARIGLPFILFMQCPREFLRRLA